MIYLGRKRVLLRSLGEKIKSLRKRKSLTQEEFAVQLNVSLDAIKNWEQGYNYPSIDMLVTIAEYFKCDFDYLLGKQDTPNKEYKHFSEYTGLSEEAIKTLLYFCKPSSILPDILDNIDFLFLTDDLVNIDYNEIELIMKIPEYANIITDPDLYDPEPKLDRTLLYKADKLELYNHMINFINNARKKRGLKPI